MRRNPLRSRHLSWRNLLWPLVGLLVALNFLVAQTASSNQLEAATAQEEGVVMGECESDADCANQCSGECDGDTRVNCFCCSGLCWECGDDCSVEEQ